MAIAASFVIWNCSCTADSRRFLILSASCRASEPDDPLALPDPSDRGKRMRLGIRLLASAMAFVAICPGYSFAQNFIDNSSFYSTMSPWKTSTPDVVHWASSPNHTADDGGSLFVGGNSGSFATQCTPVPNGVRYVISAWTYSSCTGSLLYVYWTDASCSFGSAYQFVRSTKANQWEQLVITSDQADDVNRALVQLYNPGCTAGMSFDDVRFQPDVIFWDPFDLHGVEGR